MGIISLRCGIDASAEDVVIVDAVGTDTVSPLVGVMILWV